MTQNKIKKYLTILFIISFTSLFSQNLSDNWQLIKTDEYSDIFIEPTKIVQYGNEISVWALEKLKEAQKEDNGEEVYSIKTHYLFNKMKKRYAEIGIIYYDFKGGIVNRSSKSNLSGAPSAFLTPISSNPNCEIIYNEVISYLITGSFSLISSTDINSSSDSTKNDGNDLSQNVVIESNLELPRKRIADKSASENDDTNKNIIEVELPKVEEKKDEKTTVEEKREEDIEQNIVEPLISEIMDQSGIAKSQTNVKQIQKVAISDFPNIKIPKIEYNQDSESEVDKSIFSDGKLYCFQVSSWKTKAYADKELNKLKSNGFNAIIVSVKPKNKNSIWHRVRVGYFKSLQEAKNVQREISKK
ncbi:MAG: SPOR domain-containing protein [Bacteroidetes bacterium]|nr:SPOR domain-containing protein [Bacteroidota bacterium]MBU1115761.1 SPOR domain-containing protein [Bacteroidota bacterium]MBU1799451.1 SPOR domain-containing protein [Bacteroidota bacterium]